MKITREQLRTIVGEVLQEEKDYQSFFQAMLKKHGVSSPDEFKSDEEKKAFFNKVEDTWKGVSERLQSIKEDELTSKQQKIDLNKNGKVDGDDLSKLRAGTKTEAELSAAQQKIDLNKNGKVDGDDLSKLRAGAKTEGEEQLPQTKILSKEGETLVKSGAGNMYNISKVNESKESDILAKIEKLRLDAEAGKIKTLDQFLDKFKPLQKQLKSLGESVNEEKIDWADFYKMAKDTSGYNPNFEKKYGKVLDRPHVADAVKTAKDFKSFMKFIQKFENINEGKYDADLDKIEAAVKNATSFMNVGTELKKAGIKYDFTTSMIPMYMIKVSGNTIAVVNKKYAAGAEREVKDIAIGLLN